jgi:hypothetical protein
MRRAACSGADRHPPAGLGERGERLGDAGKGAGGHHEGVEIVAPEAGEQGAVRATAAGREGAGDEGAEPVADQRGELGHRQRRQALVRQHAVQARREVRQAVDQRAVEVEKDRAWQIVALRNGN